jgi:pyruvate/2-oxoglutarate/acetoin dehydrogenase E1 component
MTGCCCVAWPKVLAPYDAEDCRGLLKAAIRDPDPVIFLENELLYGQNFPVDEKVRALYSGIAAPTTPLK